ncbi:piggyBac transposable element-derived protein 4-like [Mytilus edulis]|uniref:piggyBac transposable element-derived protein 4-like n=1 Tax=Mytilus edulis TaxID=6550 RepID=UPI0039F02B6B
MSSDESDGDFEGFSETDVINAEQEVLAAEERLRVILSEQGIGDDSDGDLNESENEDEGEEEVHIDERGDGGDGWHSRFDIYERGLPHLFNPRGNTGPSRVMGAEKEVLDFWQLYMGDQFLEFLINQTDSYANYNIQHRPNDNKMPWSIPTLPEIKAFLGLTYQMGINRKPSTKLYWSTDPVMVTPIFSSTMTRDRYTQILRYLHFSNIANEPRQGEPNYDPLYKIKPVVNHLNNKFGLEYIPKRNVTIDECMVPFKGRTLLKQYLPSKPHKWGAKVWMLAESANSYIQYIDVYPGRTVRTEGSLGSSVVKNCLEGANIAGQGYHVYTDNFFTSPNLYLELWENYDTAACGTVRNTRAGLPKDIMCKKPVNVVTRGDHQFRQKGALLAVSWKDKKTVSVLSTIHNESIGQVTRSVNVDGQFARQEFNCPSAIVDYTCNMGGVDKADQYIQYYCYHQKTLKWPKKVFFSLLEMVKFNAYRLFTLSPNHSSNLTFLQFSCLLIKGLINGYSAGVRRGRPLLAPDQRLIQRHMPTTLNSKGRCHVCYMRQKNGKQDNIRQTKYGCSVCGKHLCMPQCFTIYHTEKNYC